MPHIKILFIFTIFNHRDFTADFTDFTPVGSGKLSTVVYKYTCCVFSVFSLNGGVGRFHDYFNYFHSSGGRGALNGRR